MMTTEQAEMEAIGASIGRDGRRLLRWAIKGALQEAANRIREDAAKAQRAGTGAAADGLQMAAARVEEMLREASEAWEPGHHAVGD
jgi:uncharacterized membrane protein